MKRKAFVLLLTLLCTAMASAQLSLLASANFCAPPSNPTITIISPTNQTYNTSNVTLRVAFDTYKTGDWDGPANNETRFFTYSIDGKAAENLVITNASVGTNPGTHVFFEGSGALSGLADGMHNVSVRVVFTYHNRDFNGYRTWNTESNTTVNFKIETLSQTNNIPQTTENQTTVLIAGIVLVVTIGAVTGLLVYFRNQNKKKNEF
jgi:hypothetical protein